MVPSSTTKPRVWLNVAALAGLFALAAAVYFFVTRPKKPAEPPTELRAAALIDQTLGLAPIAGIEEEGFYYVETSKMWPGETYRWTNGAAKLTVPLGGEPPLALFVRLGLTVPRKLHLTIKVNGAPVFDDDVLMKLDWQESFDLGALKLGREMAIEVVSDTFVPAEALKGSTDGRALGVCVRGISLVSRSRDFTDTPLGVRLVPGVSEAGFSHPEQSGGQPCRWTHGAAKLHVPLRGKMPRSLAVTLEVPDQPNYKVRIAVNERALFDDTVPPNANWSVELPLAGIDMANGARIEIGSSTFVPNQIMPQSKDGRTLGVRVKRLVLVHAAE
jgi:hypothetical protein